MEQISLQIATAVEVARNFEVAQGRAARERMLGEMTAHIRERLDVESVLQAAVNELYNHLDLEEASLFLTPPEAPSPNDQEPADD